MYLVSSKLERLAALRTTLDRADHQDEELIRSIILHTCQGNPFATMASFHPMIEARAWTDLGFGLIAEQAPAWCVCRLCLDDGLWWCGMNPRVPALWAPCEVDEAHPVLAIAILKAFITALIRPACSPLPSAGHRARGTMSVAAHCE
jgi:hypothetical protein